MLEPHLFAASANPRQEGTCVKCGLPEDHFRHIGTKITANSLTINQVVRIEP